jgi:hypothetical protein
MDRELQYHMKDLNCDTDFMMEQMRAAKWVITHMKNNVTNLNEWHRQNEVMRTMQAERAA